MQQLMRTDFSFIEQLRLARQSTMVLKARLETETSKMFPRRGFLLSYILTRVAASHDISESGAKMKPLLTSANGNRSELACR